MSFLYTTVSIVGIIFMTIFSFIGIWLFVVALKTFRQLKYRNYILEKIYQKLDNTQNNIIKESGPLKDSFDFFDLGGNDKVTKMK